MHFTKKVPEQEGWYWVLVNGGISKKEGFYKYTPRPERLIHDRVCGWVINAGWGVLLDVKEFQFGDRIETPEIESVEGVSPELLKEVQE